MQSTKYLLSICSLSYNHAKFIRKAIESYLNQDYNNIEIIALDDGSSDESAEILKETLGELNIPFKIIEQENSGNIGGNFNRLFEASSGEFVIFTALDDIMIPNTFLKKIRILTDNPSAAFVAPSLTVQIDENDNQVKTYPAPIYGKKNLTPSDLLELTYLHTCAFYIQGAIFRREIIEKAGGFDESLIADDLVLESRIFKYMETRPHITFHILDEPGFYYRVHSSNTHKIKDRQLKSMIQYYKTWWPDREPSPGLIRIILETVSQRKIDEIFHIFYMDEYMKKILCSDKRVQKALAFAYERDNLKYGARYKRLEFPLFKIEKYKDSEAGKKYLLINILGLKLVFSRDYGN